MAVPQRFEVGENSGNGRQLLLSWRCDFIQRRGRMGSLGKDCAWSNWRKLGCLLVNHIISLEERVKVLCVTVRPALLYSAETLGTNEKIGRTAS